MESNEKVVEIKSCKYCSSSFEVTDKDMEFYEKVSPVFGGKKFFVPPPTLCPDCRNRRRLSWRNEGNLYKRKCDATGKDIVSMYSPDKKLIVYDKEIWNSDKVDGMNFGGEVNFIKSFFEQFEELLYKVPIPSMTFAFESENSEYAIYAGKMKNCYMLFASWECESTMYSSRLIKTNSVIDITDGTNLERCYQLINAENCYGCFYIINSNNCQNCFFSYDLTNCSECILCYNLAGKKYCINNVEYEKEDYLKRSKEIKKHNLLQGWQFINEMIPKTINKNLMMVNCDNCVGDNLKNCKNCINCFHFEESENCKFSDNGGMGCYNTYDGIGVGENLQFGYEIFDTGINATKNCFLISCYTCNFTYYSINCHHSSNLFGCIGLRNKSYCILNKQYIKEEYEVLVPQIIEHMLKTGEWGEFFPSSLSPFGYNETAAMDYFPLTRDDVLNDTKFMSGSVHNDTFKCYEKSSVCQLIKGVIFNWSDYEAPFPKVEKIIPAHLLPESTADTPDDILNWAIECEVTKRPFKIVRQELEFYRKNDIPLPKKHPTERYIERLNLHNPKQIFDRKCDKCMKDLKSIFSIHSGKIVYCEKCYNGTIY